MNLPFAQRACFAAGQAKSGTTLLIALLDGHPQLLVLPEETAYFPTALNKYEKFGRRAQVDYLTNEALVPRPFRRTTGVGKNGLRPFSDRAVPRTLRSHCIRPE